MKAAQKEEEERERQRQREEKQQAWLKGKQKQRKELLAEKVRAMCTDTAVHRDGSYSWHSVLLLQSTLFRTVRFQGCAKAGCRWLCGS